ncbi:MAG: hypothetical protein JW731_12255 [Bacteroidales bacterium]|nr:hypothetical protein [Bacteroidales bacterium]
MSRFFLVICIIYANLIFAQESVWNKINGSNSELPNESIKCIAFDTTGASWIGTYMGGLAVLNNNSWKIYNTSNSELPHNYINAICIDNNNVKWVGTDGGGLAKLEGETWTIFKTSNSGLPSNVVMSVFCDKGIVWVGTYFGGLAKFDGENWKVFNDENSPLLSNKVVTITKDTNNILWLGTQGGGVASYDGNNWNVYTERNSKLASDYVYSIAVDEKNNKWIGTGGGGVAVFNDVYWISFNTNNSDLTDDNIRPILIDKKGYKWIGTYIGGVNMFDGESWKTYDFQNSVLPDDEITCFGYHNQTMYIGTERSGIITVQDTLQVKPTNLVEEITTVKATSIMFDDNKPLDEKPAIKADTTFMATATVSTNNSIVLVFDAADVYFDNKRLNKVLRSFKLLLNNREKIDETYKVLLLVYSTNFDVSPKKIQLTETQLKQLHASNVVYMEGESTFTEGIRKAFDILTQDYNSAGNNHVISATYKFIRDDETAKVVIKDNYDNNYIIFSLLAFETSSWKLEHKMRSMIPKGGGHYYSINEPGIKDNWSATAQLGFSIFRGDLDVNRSISIPGEIGFAINKQVLGTGILNGGIKAQFNFGGLKGSNDQGYSFENKYKEGCLNFQVILNNWINRNFRFEKFRPYAFAGIGFINYRVLLYDKDNVVIGGYGYDIPENANLNGSKPDKTKAETDLIFPLGLGVNYKLNSQFNIELEASSRYIASDRLDGVIRYKDDKYWFISLGITYLFNNKEFLSDILTR